MRNPIVVSLGGSIMCPDDVDIAFLRRFRRFILGLKRDVLIVTGGGRTARRYIKAVAAFDRSREAQDWMGISATGMNAQLMKAIFGDKAHPEVIVNPTHKVRITRRIAIARGWKPGCSTDLDAVLLARTYKAKVVINLSNTEYIYTRDPRKPGAERLERLTWKELQRIVGSVWRPGANLPFDPIATKLAARLGLTLYAIDGRRLNDVRRAIEGKPFKGSIVE